MIPTTPNTRLNPPVSGPLSRQVRALRMTVGPRAVQRKNAATSLLEKEKAPDENNGHSHVHAFESRCLMYDT